MGSHGVAYVSNSEDQCVLAARRKLGDSGPGAEGGGSSCRQPTQTSTTQTGRLEENTRLDDSCLQLCPAFELFVRPEKGRKDAN